MKKYAIMDIGTNSVRLLIAEVVDDKIFHREKHLITTRLGQGVDEKKMINSETILRNLSALRELKERSLKRGVDEFIVFGTSALRDAQNADVFVMAAKKELDLDIQVIDGQREAEYAFFGVSEQAKEDSIVIMDIGGGSTELVCAQQGKIVHSKSFDIGSVRITERFIKHDPPTKSEVKALLAFVQEVLSQSYVIKESFDLIGIGGTATTLSQIKQKMPEYLPEKIHNSQVTIEELEKMIAQFLAMDDGQRKEIVGLSPKRSDVITAGALIVFEVMKRYGKEAFTVSDYDNLEGALLYQIKQGK